jgi:hypothetical protein
MKYRFTLFLFAVAVATAAAYSWHAIDAARAARRVAFRSAKSVPAFYRTPAVAQDMGDSPGIVRKVWETTMQPQRYKVARPTWEIQQREETYMVKRPVVETSLKSEQVTVYQPVTTYATQYVDQGAWVECKVFKPGPMVTRLGWDPGGWTTDPKTGASTWRLPALRPTRSQAPGTYETKRVWQSKMVPIQVPQTSYGPQQITRQVPVQSIRYVEEQQVRKVPVHVCRMIEEEQVRMVPVTTCREVTEQPLRRSQPRSAPLSGKPRSTLASFSLPESRDLASRQTAVVDR